ncbi:unnamed protein product [Phyllotreta striolata]|uniref:Fibronectin type-III domain-containing protein n=1 Tax=Phyllotreta striolata TaxID=444603 RepID=A0A9N9TN19_PHYSR|nr:unnamed protein product [Phyllotreta striolata]
MKKFLHLFLLQFLFASVRSIEDNDVFIFADNKWCITNSSSAITFRNYPKDGHYSSSLYPAIKDKSFNCNFEDNEECNYKEPSWHTGNWINQNSIYSILPITEPITDERWESFPIVKTKGDLFVDKLQYKEVLVIRDRNRDHFAIPLSVKIEKEAHIYLCDGENPVVSNCYWIMLGMSDGKMSKIRKCNAGQISYEYDEYPTDPYCSNGLVQNNVNPLNEDEWKHFLIRRRGGFLGIYQNNKIFLHITDTEKPYNTKKVFVHSKKADGLWKIHVYNFLESITKSENNDPLGPRFEVDTEICLSMFIKTSPGSTLRIQIKPKGYNFFSEVFQTEGIWKKIKIYRKIENNQLIKTDYNFYITRKGKGYWAVDDIRRCTNEEYRYIKSNDDDDECHLLSSDKPTIISMKSKKREISTTGIDCRENSFSTACIPCKIFGQEYCPKLKYCDVAEKCYCSAGYTDVKCNKDCPRGTYGHGCQKKSYCSKNNDPVTGYCPASCETPFTGSTCNISSTPFFLNDPLVVDITDTSFNIQQVDLQYVGNGAQYYTFQYSNDDDGSNKWVQVDEKIHLNVSKIVKVTGLEPDTNYSVRAIIIGRQSRLEKFSKTRQNFTTSCQKLSKDDVVIDTFNTSAIVKIMLHFNSCKMSKYLYCLNTCVNLLGNKFNISSLTPHKEYNLKFVHSNKTVLNITFNTTDGVPSFVTDITEKSSANSLELNWEKPETENGEIVGYEIAYTLYKHLACNFRENNPLIYHLNTTEKHIRLENLQPYSRYEISIRALSRAFKGKFKPKQVITTSSDELSPDEKVSISQVIVAGYPRILWNSIDCSTRRGPIFVQSKTVCLSEWCDRLNETIVDDFPYQPEGKTLLTKLQSYCNYTITLSISRNKTNWLFSDSFNFTSNPTSPGSVTQLSVYSKNDSSISLRWKKPYPPTGVLKEYKIDYYYYYFSIKYTNRIILRASEATCNLWKEFHCATITKEVYNNYVYHIKVFANNEKPDEFGTSSAIEIKNTQAGPEPPYNLNYEWTDDNELFVTFYHPNNTNGILTSFELMVFDKSELKYINYENYQLRYKFQYEDLTFLATRKTCSRFEMHIRAHNTYTSSIFTKLQIIVPPSIPAGIKTFNYKSEMTSIAIHLIFTQPYPDRAIILLSKGIDADELRSFETGDFIDRKPRGNFTSFWVVYDNENLDSPVEFEIGDGNSTWQELTNPALESGRKYTIVVYLVNYCQNFLAKWMKQEWVVQTEGESVGPSSEEIFIDNDNDGESDDGRNLWALLLLVLIPIVLFGVWFVKKKNMDLHRFMNSIGSECR